MSAARVLIADAQPLARSSLRRVLEEADFAIAGEAAAHAEAVALANRERPDVLLIDTDLPGGGIGAILDVAAAHPETAIIAFTAARDAETLFDTIRAGAVGYLLKDINPERIPHAVQGVLDGEAAIPRSLVALLVSELRARGSEHLVIGPHGRTRLTRREWEIAQLLADGASTARIAERLFLSPVTVRRHVANVVAKLGVQNRSQAVALIARARAQR